jgi:hypothetical protein
LPALRPDQLQAKLDELADLHGVSGAGKQLIAASLRAASTGEAETAASTIRSLPPERQREVLRGQQMLAAARVSKMASARAGLLAMSDAEWDALVEEAAEDAE